MLAYEPPHDKTNKVACVPSEDSDQSGHPPSLVRVFVVRTKKAQVLSYLLSAQRRLWSDWADAQADLSLCWAHSHFAGIVMRRLIYVFVLVVICVQKCNTISSRRREKSFSKQSIVCYCPISFYIVFRNTRIRILVFVGINTATWSLIIWPTGKMYNYFYPVISDAIFWSDAT